MYKTIDIELSNHSVDILQTTRSAQNEKHRLVLLCEVELSEMIETARRQQEERDRMKYHQMMSRHRHEAFYAYLQHAISIKYLHPEIMTISVCNQALRNESIIALYNAVNQNLITQRYCRLA